MRLVLGGCVANEAPDNCHGCKHLDRYKVDGSGYCAMVVRSKLPERKRCRYPDMVRCELYEKGDFTTRYAEKEM